jgi:putative ABC transport system ATP-binding protein
MNPVSTPPALVVRDLFHLVGPKAHRRAVLEDLSFELAAGEFLCLMGPSGSGKSSLLHLVAGLDEPAAGEIELAGRVLGDCSAAERTRLRRDGVGYVFQFFNLLPNLTVLENVGLPLAIRGMKRREQEAPCLELLERFGLGDRGGAFPHELSGGEMQRVSIARALAGDQPLLICDEPTGNLSQKAGAEIMAVLRELVDRDQKTVLLVTHNPRDACSADRVLFLVDGRIAAHDELAGSDISIDAVHAALEELGI